jgi:hypothetical protein
MWKTFTLLLTCFICLTTFSLKAQNNKLPFNDGSNKIVKLYPNPASSRINFELQHTNNDEVYDLIVFNFLGKRVDQIKNVSSRTTVELDRYYSGIYIFQLRDREGNLIESGKFNVVK